MLSNELRQSIKNRLNLPQDIEIEFAAPLGCSCDIICTFYVDGKEIAQYNGLLRPEVIDYEKLLYFIHKLEKIRDELITK